MGRGWNRGGLGAALAAGLIACAAVPAAATPFAVSYTDIFSTSRQLTIGFTVPTTIDGPMSLTVTLIGQFVQNAENATVAILDPLGNIDLGRIGDNDPNNDLFPGADPNGGIVQRSISLGESLIAPLIQDGLLTFHLTITGAVAVTANPARPIMTLDFAWEAPEPPPPAVAAPAAGLLFATGLALMGLRRRR